MKRYLLFAGLKYYPRKAWEDFKISYDILANAQHSAKQYINGGAIGDCEWYQIVDTETGEIVENYEEDWE